ncbi:MAG: CdaR family protein [Hespellia sp.]|nr:CdaR family protein [Hespellia sp.]
MKHKWTENLGLKLMAVFFAAILWLIVVNIDNPIDTVVFRGITVAVQNEELVTNKGKTYQIIGDTQTVNVTVQAKRSVLDKISSADIIATADMKDMQLSSLVPITVSIKGYEGRYTSAVANPINLQVNIEDTTKNTIPLTVSTTGTPRDGYVLGTMVTNPEKVVVRGAEALVNSIAKAVAKVDVSGLSADATLKADLIFYDENENVVDQTLLNNNLGEDAVTVDVQVLNTKSVPLDINVSGTPAAGYAFAGVSSEPESIQIIGTEEELKGIDQITIPGSAVDIDDISEKQEIVVDISGYLPDDVTLADETANNVVVTVVVEQEGTKTVELPREAVVIKNLADGLKVSYDNEDDIELHFSGTEDALDKLNITNAVSIDLKNSKTPGTYEVPLTLDLPSGITLLENVIVKVVVEQKLE